MDSDDLQKSEKTPTARCSPLSLSHVFAIVEVYGFNFVSTLGIRVCMLLIKYRFFSSKIDLYVIWRALATALDLALVCSF